MAFEIGNIGKKSCVLALAVILLSSSSAASLGFLSEDEETKTASVEISGLSDLNTVRDEGGEILERSGRYLLIEGTSSIFSSLESRGTEVSVIDEVEEEPINYTDEELETDYPFADYYPSVDDLNEWYDELEDEYPELVETHNYGTSWEGRELWAIEITSDEDTRVEEKPGVLIDGALHAREWSSVQTSAYYMWRLLDEYETNETINWLVNNRRLFVVPMTNPDGYIFDGDGDLDAAEGWRKNRNESVGDEGEVGVDLNRNWDADFGGRGTSDDPSSDQYHGEEPFSEYETYYLKEFLLENDIDSYHNIHSHADTLLIPYMHTDEPSPHDDWYRGTADHMTSLTTMLGEDEQYSYGQPQEEIGYSAAGGASDWAYAKEGMQGFTFEIYTPEGGMEGFYPDEEYIMPINKDVDDSLIYQSRVADVDLGDGPMGEGGEDLFPPVPYLVYGEVETGEGDPISDVSVEVESQETGETLGIETDSNGYYELNFGNLVDEGYDVGDPFTIRAEDTSRDFTVGNDWGRREDLTIGAVPPSIDITSPTGGEVWNAGEEVEIMWEATEGEGAMTEVDLEYSIDDGASWSYIEQGLGPTDSHTWVVPDEPTEVARIRATVHDEDGLSGSDVSEPFTIDGDGVEQHTLTIDITGQGNTNPPEGTHTYEEGEEVTVTAIPDTGWDFKEWSGDHVGEEDEITITMDENKEITAHFEEEGEYELTINVEGEGSTEPSEGSHIYDEDEVVTVEATPAEDWLFKEWTGDETGSETTIEITMDEDKSVTAVFEEDLVRYELTIDIEGQGSTDPDEGTHAYEEDESVTVTATPAEDWLFDQWTGDVTGTEPTTEITMDDDKEITAVFKEDIVGYELTIEVEGEGSTDPSEGTHSYEEGEEVTITATPAEGWNFDGWVGDEEETEDELTIVMDEDKSITAVFEAIEYDLTINVDGEGSTDPEEGTHTYKEGEDVTIIATPEESWNFEEWTGDETGTDRSIEITMDDDKSVTAVFEVITYNLTINIEGEGNTTPSEGNHTYEEGTVVTIETMPEDDWEFSEWTGDAAGSETSINITMDGEKEITATFEEEDEDTPGFTLALLLLTGVIVVAIYHKKKR